MEIYDRAGVLLADEQLGEANTSAGELLVWAVSVARDTGLSVEAFLCKSRTLYEMPREELREVALSFPGRVLVGLEPRPEITRIEMVRF